MLGPRVQFELLYGSDLIQLIDLFTDSCLTQLIDLKSKGHYMGLWTTNYKMKDFSCVEHKSCPPW